jgi:hypothetical protein
MPPLGLARRPHRAAAEVGCTVLRMAPAHCGLHRQQDTRQRPVSGGAMSLRLLDGGKIHQVSHLAVKVPLGRILWLWQRLLEDRGKCDVLACTELLRELHACVADDVVVDRMCASTCGTRGVHSFGPGGGPWRLSHKRRRLLAMAKVVAVGQCVGERVLAVVRWGVRLLRRHHLRRRVAVGHGAHAQRRGCPL